MCNDIVIKQYKIDYDFIVKNYLDPSLWSMEWNLFVYNKTVVTLQLYSIDTINRRITFAIRIQDDVINGSRRRGTLIDYDLQHNNYKVLEKQINGGIRECIQLLEQSHIERSDFYRKLESSRSDEIDILTNIANNFLDENGVTNSAIREAYVDRFVYDNETTYDTLNDYKRERKYKELSDLWLVFYKALGDEETYQFIINKIKEENEELLENVKKIIELFENQEGDDFEEYRYDMENRLESI